MNDGTETTTGGRTGDPLLDPEKISRLGNLELVARVVVEGFLRGVHRSPYRGSSVEFSQNRPYVPGDEISRIDWRAYGKTDRLYLREYEDETNLRLTLLVDGSASMSFASQGISKFRYASCLGAALGQLILRQLDAVGLLVFDRDVRRWIPPRASRTHFQGVLAELEDVVPAGETSLGPVLRKAAEAIPSRGFVVLLSDLLDDPGEILRGLTRFRAARSEVVVFHVIDPAEREFPFPGWIDFRDMESAGSRQKIDARWIRETYLENFRKHLDQIRAGCIASHIDYQLVDVTTPFDVTLSRFLAARRKHGAGR